MTAHRQALVIGLGNDYRGDDAIGRLVARRLKAMAGDDVRVLEENGEGARRVVGVKVTLGALSHLSPDHFREHFEAAATDTIAEAAKLDIEILRDECDPHSQDILLDSVEVEDQTNIKWIFRQQLVRSQRTGRDFSNDTNNLPANNKAPLFH
jgi:hydrogenase nickel incorporation protein HypA/HybF